MRAFLRALSFRMLALALILTLLAAPQAQAEDEKTSQKRSFRFCERLRLICYNFVTKNP